MDLDIPAGRLTALAGPSGSGKSTLLRLIAALDRPTTGTVTADGIELGGLSEAARRRWRRRRLGFVFQDPAANLFSYLDVSTHLRMAMRLHRSDPSELSEMTKSLEIDQWLELRPVQLSSGQQQRVALAMAAVGDPAVVVADEPTAELDAYSAAPAIDTLVRLRDRGSTVVVSTHDPELIRQADHVFRLDHGHHRS